jgi:uncharacterized protein YpmS
VNTPEKSFRSPVLTFSFITVLYVSCCINQALAALPDGNAVKSSLFETLKSVTSNVSTTVTDEVDKMISDTMDIMISDAMDKLENATVYGNKVTAAIKFEPKVPTGIDVTR